ncbi:protein CREG1-like [Forsythia ovata]|uniref:Protein CREG1-like n=1 Tax=Forsythia ovata TaxID=205694 RepID=A0ABD1WS39_9LAMI
MIPQATISLSKVEIGDPESEWKMGHFTTGEIIPPTAQTRDDGFMQTWDLHGFQSRTVDGPLLLSGDRPRPDDVAVFARWLVCQNSWGVLSTISTDWGGAPFGNVVSFSDDPENPTCAKITLIGKLKLLDGDSEEAEFAQTALFTKHPEMKGWPKSHKFQIFKLDIENIFMINWFGGPKPLTVDQYLQTKMDKLTLVADTTS